MTTLQVWLIVGIPGLVVAAGLFAGRSRIRSLLGYVVLAALVAVFATVSGDVFSTAAVGLIGFVLVATGRGTAVDEGPEEHENRKRYTTAPSGG